MTEISDVFKDLGVVKTDDVFSDLGVERPVDNVQQEITSSLKDEEILSNPLATSALRKHMINRFGVQWEKRSDEEVLDGFKTHQRRVATNEVNTIAEAYYISQADDEKKAAAGTAYKIFDSMAPFWDNGAGESLEAVKDYGMSILTSPSTWLGGIVGKGVGHASSAAVRQGIIVAAKQAAKTGGIDAAKKVLASGAKAKIITEAATATAVDAGVGVFQDYVYQDTRMKTGAQDDYSLAQTGITALGGLISGGVSVGFNLRKGKIGITAKDIRASKKAHMAQASGFAANRIKKSIKQLTTQLTAMQAGQSDWVETVEGGMKQNPGIKELTENVAWFFDLENPDSIARIIIDSGAHLRTGEGERFTEQLVDFIHGLPQKELDEINAELEPALGLKLGQLVERIAAGESKAGSMMNQAMRAKLYARDAVSLSAAQRAADKVIIGGFDKSLNANVDLPTDSRPFKYMTSLWRRAVVSHPGTTMVNILGWGQGYFARSIAEVVHGGILGSMGMATALGNKTASKEALRKSRALFANQVFKLRTLMDPYGSREAFETLLHMAPKRVQDKAMAEYFGGIGGAPANYGLSNKGVVKGAETAANYAARISLIKAQDVYTKTFSALAELDRLSRLEYSQGLDELVASGDYWKITEGMWNTTLRTLLQDTFSMDYTKAAKGSGGFEEGLSSLAGVVETISNHPVLGYIFPFGRFMNNTLAFMSQYSPIGLLPIAARMRRMAKAGAIDSMAADTLTTDISKTLVGTVGLASLIDYSMKTQEEGMQWNEVEGSSGEIHNLQNAAPASAFLVLARIGSHLEKGEAVPQELIGSLRDQVGPWAWSKELTGDTPIASMLQYLSRETNPDDLQSAWALIGEAMVAFSGQVGAGFTRPLDPFNKIAGMLTETDAAIDRRQAEDIPERLAVELTRYTDNFFDLILDEPLGDTARSVERPEGEIREANPVGGLVGTKTTLPKNYTERLLGMVDMPAWLLNQRSGIPEADRFINGEVAKLLNDRAKHLLNDPEFKKASMAIKRDMTKMLLSTARDDIKSRLAGGEIGDEENRLAEARRVWLTQPQALRDEARKELGISTPDRKLSGEEILELRSYLGFLRQLLGERTQ